MLDKDELEKIAERIPARTKYAVIASWAETDETADTWDDLEHVHYCYTWADACDARRAVEADGDGGLVAYIVEPSGPYAEADA